MRGVNDNADLGTGGPFLPATVAVFLPSLIIICGYGMLFSALALAGRADGAIARLCIAVIALGGPFLLAHAALRRFTIRADLMPHAAYLHTGFPAGQPFEAPYGLIRRAEVRRGLVGRLTGSGTLVVELLDGRRIAVCDLARPDAAAAAIEHLAAREIQGPFPVVGSSERITERAGETLATNF